MPGQFLLDQFIHQEKSQMFLKQVVFLFRRYSGFFILIFSNLCAIILNPVVHLILLGWPMTLILLLNWRWRRSKTEDLPWLQCWASMFSRSSPRPDQLQILTAIWRIHSHKLQKMISNKHNPLSCRLTGIWSFLSRCFWNHICLRNLGAKTNKMSAIILKFLHGFHLFRFFEICFCY